MNQSLPLLSILIPTYNRSRYLNRLLRSFRDFGLGKSCNFEIIVANNRSLDDTREILASYADSLPTLKVIHHDEHVPTAEENVFRSFRHCSGKYVWVLGDDDVPVFESFPMLMRELESDSHDFLIFNSSVIAGDSRITNLTWLSMHSEKFTGEIADITVHNGYWFILAGMSGQVLRASCVKDFDFSEVLGISVIYSHVTAYLQCFAGKSTTLFNYPIVWYKVVDRDEAHWQKAARTLNVFDQFFWTLGFIRQLKHLIKVNVFEKNVLFQILDTNGTFRFRIMNVVHEKFFEQIQLGRKSTDPRQKLSESDFREIADFLLESNVFFRECLWDIESLYRMPKRKFPSREERELEQLLTSKIEKRLLIFRTELLYGFFVRKYKTYIIYRIHSRYYGVPEGCESFLEKELSYVDPLPRHPLLFIATNVVDVMDQIDLEGHGEALADLEVLFQKEKEAPPNLVRKYLNRTRDFEDLLEEKDKLLEQYSSIIEARNDILYKGVAYMVARKLYHIVRGFYRAFRGRFGGTSGQAKFKLLNS